MSKTYSHTELTIRRANGEIEVVRAQNIAFGMTDAKFAAIKKATKAAGRGDCLSYVNVQRDMTADELAQVAEISSALRNERAYTAATQRIYGA